VTDIRRALEQSVDDFHPTDDALDLTLQKFRRRQRRQRLFAAGTALALSFATMSWLWVGFGGLAQPSGVGQERSHVQARLDALERQIRERQALESRLQTQASAEQALTEELQGLLGTLREQLRQRPPADERQEILDRIQQTRTALEAHLSEVAAIKTRLSEVEAQLARAVGQREVLRQWLASLEDSP